MDLATVLAIASGLHATTYGFGEKMCGDVDRPRACAVGATTASGEPFDPSVAQVAVAAPFNLVLKSTRLRIRVDGGRCHTVQLTDKMHPRWIGVRGFDLTPRAVELLTGKPAHPKWSGIVHVCEDKK